MEPSPSMLDFVKAMSDANRLRIIGILTQRPANAQTVAGELGIPFRDAVAHLAFLSFVGVIRTDTGDNSQEAIYDLDPEGTKTLAKARLSLTRPGSYAPAPHMDEKTRKVLVTCLNADGTIKRLPVQQPAKLKIILEYLIEAFTPGVDYSETEVNSIIRHFHEDVSGLRRDMVDAGMLERERDGSRYWRMIAKGAE